jgi:hypothetical protein
MSVLWQVINFVDEYNGLFTALASALIGGFTATIWVVNRQQGFDTRTIQRAYVKISHPPPGVAGHLQPDAGDLPAALAGGTDRRAAGYHRSSGSGHRIRAGQSVTRRRSVRRLRPVSECYGRPSPGGAFKANSAPR